MQAIWVLVVLSIKKIINVHAKHIERVSNIAADFISQLQVKEFQARFPYIDPVCTTRDIFFSLTVLFFTQVLFL